MLARSLSLAITFRRHRQDNEFNASYVQIILGYLPSWAQGPNRRPRGPCFRSHVTFIISTFHHPKHLGNRCNHNSDLPDGKVLSKCCHLLLWLEQQVIPLSVEWPTNQSSQIMPKDPSKTLLRDNTGATTDARPECSSCDCILLHNVLWPPFPSICPTYVTQLVPFLQASRVLSSTFELYYSS